jgi:glycosyltransferase involved in cell wall biosynthesis
MPPTMSVVMPVYNAAAYVEQAVASILSQTLADFEFLIFDDGSTDDSPRLLADLAHKDRRIRLTRGPHLGYVPWLNKSIADAVAPFLARMDADDVALPARLERQADYLAAHPECVALGTNYVSIDSDGDVLGRSDQETEPPRIHAQLLGGKLGVLAHPTVVMRLDAVRRVGGYNAQFEPSEDLDLWFRLAEYGELANLGDELLLYRQHVASVCYSQAERQRRHLDRIVTDGRARQGLPPLAISLYVSPELPEWRQHRRWARWALGAGEKRTARKHARRALRAHASDVQSRLVLLATFLPLGVLRRLLDAARFARRAVRDGTPQLRRATSVLRDEPE